MSWEGKSREVRDGICFCTSRRGVFYGREWDDWEMGVLGVWNINIVFAMHVRK